MSKIANKYILETLDCKEQSASKKKLKSNFGLAAVWIQKDSNLNFAWIFDPNNWTPKILEKYPEIHIWNLVFCKKFNPA